MQVLAKMKENKLRTQIYHYLKKSTQVTSPLFLPQEYFRSLVKPIVDQLLWSDTGGHLERLNNLWVFFLLILLMDSKNTKQ